VTHFVQCNEQSSTDSGKKDGENVSGAAPEDRRLVVDPLAATARDNGRTAGEACSLLLAAFGGESSDAAALWSPAVQDSGATIAIGGEDEIHDKTTAVLFNEVQA
jgi:hypothetical protein